QYREAGEAAAAAGAILTGPARLAAIGEQVAALGQLAAFDRIEALAASVWAEAPAPAALTCLLRVAGYLMPAGRYDGVRRILALVEQHRPSLDAVARIRLAYLLGVEAAQDGNPSAAPAAYDAAAGGHQALGDLRSAIEMRANVGAAL